MILLFHTDLSIALSFPRFGRRKPLCAYLILGSIMNIAAGVLSEKAGSCICFKHLHVLLFAVNFLPTSSPSQHSQWKHDLVTLRTSKLLQ